MQRLFIISQFLNCITLSLTQPIFMTMATPTHTASLQNARIHASISQLQESLKSNKNETRIKNCAITKVSRLATLQLHLIPFIGKLKREEIE